jgi:hypothetical protein
MHIRTIQDVKYRECDAFRQTDRNVQIATQRETLNIGARAGNRTLDLEVSLIVVDRSFVAANGRELARMRALVSRLSDGQLGAMVNEYWSVAGVLGHIALWDGRALYLAGKLQRREPFTASENEPEDVDWINDSSRPLIHAIAPRALAELAVRIAAETDELVASLSDELAGLDETSPLNPVRANHRSEHLDEIEAAIRSRT